nr:hypothetical protein [Tanacetum cinerariifolium]
MSWFLRCSCVEVRLMVEIVSNVPMCGDPLEHGVRCQWCTCKWCGYNLREGFCLFCSSRDGNSSINAPNSNSFNDPPNVFTHPPQPKYESYSCELCGNDSHYGYDCPPWSDSECDLPSCDDFSPINIPEGKSVTFSNPLFDSNDDFTSSDDELLSDEDVLEDNFKIYSNPLFEFDDEYISITPLSVSNEDECFDQGDDIELLLHRDPSTLKMSIASILEGFTNEPSLEENYNLFDLKSKENQWKKILYDAPINDLMNEDKVFDPGISKKIFSPTNVSLPFKD